MSSAVGVVKSYAVAAVDDLQNFAHQDDVFIDTHEEQHRDHFLGVSYFPVFDRSLQEDCNPMRYRKNFLRSNSTNSLASFRAGCLSLVESSPRA